MKNTLILCAALFGLSACADKQGIGFGAYEVDAKKGSLAQTTEVKWTAQKPIPRYRVARADTAQVALATQPYAKFPLASVAAVSAPDVWLRIVEDGTQVWLVAEGGKSAASNSAGLNIEATQRSGCLVVGAASTGLATVYRLNCR